MINLRINEMLYYYKNIKNISIIFKESRYDERDNNLSTNNLWCSNAHIKKMPWKRSDANL